MKPTDRPIYAIWQLMGAIAALGSVLAIPRLVRSPDRVVLFGVLVGLTSFALAYPVIGAVFAKVCPACSRRAHAALFRMFASRVSDRKSVV